MNETKNLRDCIANTIDGKLERGGPRLTAEARNAAVEHAAKFVESGPGRGMNWGQLADVGIKHVTSGVLK